MCVWIVWRKQEAIILIKNLPDRTMGWVIITNYYHYHFYHHVDVMMMMIVDVSES